MKALNNLRVYKVITADGFTYFEVKLFDRPKATRCMTTQDLGDTVKDAMKEILDSIQEPDEADRRVTIDLHPFHDIECPNGAVAYRCFALTEEEAKDFWKSINCAD